MTLNGAEWCDGDAIGIDFERCPKPKKCKEALKSLTAGKMSDFHLYYKLPYCASMVNGESENRCQILRSDTEKIVTYASTPKKAEQICKKFSKTGILPKMNNCN